MIKIFNVLTATASTNMKVDILKRYESDLLKRVLFMALNKYWRYGFKALPEPIVTDTPQISLDFALDFVERELLGNHRSLQREQGLAEVLGSLSTGDADVLSRVVLKDFDCGIAVGLVNKAFPKLIPEFKVLLAKPGKEKNLMKLVYPVMAQIKYDGGRCNVDIDNYGNLSIFTRNGNLMNLHGRFDNEFPPEANHSMIDGELIAYDKQGVRIPRKKSNGIITKATRGSLTKEQSMGLRFVAWDIVDRDNFINQETQMTPCKTRYENVKQLLEGYSDIISIAEHRILNSFEEVLAYYNECIQNGEEGIVIKNLFGVWELKRSNDMVKMKAEHDASLRIVGINKGTGKRAGLFKSFALETEDGLLEVNCFTGISNKQAIDFLDEKWIGFIVNITYNEQIQSETSNKRSMFLPVFQEISYERDTANYLKDLV